MKTIEEVLAEIEERIETHVTNRQLARDDKDVLAGYLARTGGAIDELNDLRDWIKSP